MKHAALFSPLFKIIPKRNNNKVDNKNRFFSFPFLQSCRIMYLPSERKGEKLVFFQYLYNKKERERRKKGNRMKAGGMKEIWKEMEEHLLLWWGFQ